MASLHRVPHPQPLHQIPRTHTLVVLTVLLDSERMSQFRCYWFALTPSRPHPIRKSCSGLRPTRRSGFPAFFAPTPVLVTPSPVCRQRHCHSSESSQVSSLTAWSTILSTWSSRMVSWPWLEDSMCSTKSLGIGKLVLVSSHLWQSRKMKDAAAFSNGCCPEGKERCEDTTT